MRERLAVGEDDVRDGVGRHVLQSVVALQPQLVVAQQRVRLDERVAGRAGVEAKAGQRQLLRRGAPARLRPRLEDEHLVARLREVRGRDQAVVAAARDDDVGDRLHGISAEPFPLAAAT